MKDFVNIMRAERQRTGNYGADYDDEECEDDMGFMYDEDDIADAEYEDICWRWIGDGKYY